MYNTNILNKLEIKLRIKIQRKYAFSSANLLDIRYIQLFHYSITYYLIHKYKYINCTVLAFIISSTEYISIPL